MGYGGTNFCREQRKWLPYSLVPLIFPSGRVEVTSALDQEGWAEGRNPDNDRSGFERARGAAVELAVAAS